MCRICCPGCSTLWITYGWGGGIYSFNCIRGMKSWTFFLFAGGGGTCACAFIFELFFSNHLLNYVSLSKISNVEEDCGFSRPSPKKLPFSLEFSGLAVEEMAKDSLDSFSMLFLWEYSCDFRRGYLKFRVEVFTSFWYQNM